SPKEKSSMCLVNQLARFNKITPSYNLISEEGPAHKKVFQVQLKFGVEEFTATGQSIKKAQHAAAAEALVNTKYPSPPLRKKVNPSLTPTVELNSIAMKTGEVAAYKVVGGFKGRKLMENQDIVHIKRLFLFFRIEKIFILFCEGHSMMNARHDAASKALAVLKAEDLVTKNSKNVKLKSEISQVYEVAYRRKFTVNFEVVKESGPPHMKLYITRCTCGDLMVEEGGNSKKTSKKQSAIKMLQELNKLPPLPVHLNEQSNDKPYRKFFNKHKTNKNLKPNPDCAADMNPVSRLIQILQAKKEQEPQFLTTEKGSGRDREFCVQVSLLINLIGQIYRIFISCLLYYLFSILTSRIFICFLISIQYQNDISYMIR
ncbi:hypothetical protein HELRODRAFT_73388, partial [Helobdella robusta]|uniref:DRBM domain-containing protein n=1 Tax=Helobdella robusta TaxID=6412 RepID=T1G1D4_HELRO